MEQKKLIFNFFVNRNWKKLTDSRKRDKILADNRKSHHPIETLAKDKGYKYFAIRMVVNVFQEENFTLGTRNTENQTNALTVKEVMMP